MTALIITAAIIMLIALLRFGACVEYDSNGVVAKAKIGFISIRLYPRPRGDARAKKAKHAIKKGKRKEKPKKPKQKAPGSIERFSDIVHATGKVLGRFRRRLLVKDLTIHYVSAYEDPSKTALMFGRATAVSNALIPIIESAFRIRRCDVRASADFDAKKPGIFVRASISIAVWEAIYVIAAVLPIVLKLKPVVKASEKTQRLDSKIAHHDKKTKMQKG